MVYKTIDNDGMPWWVCRAEDESEIFNQISLDFAEAVGRGFTFRDPTIGEQTQCEAAFRYALWRGDAHKFFAVRPQETLSFSAIC